LDLVIPSAGGEPLCSLAGSVSRQQAAPELSPELGSSMAALQVGVSSNRDLGAWQTLGNSREPPVYPENFRWLPSDRAITLQSGSRERSLSCYPRPDRDEAANLAI